MKYSSLGKNWPKTADSSICSTWCAPNTLKRWRSWNHLEEAGTTWNELELSGTRCNQLHQDGTINKLTQKSKKFIRRKLCRQYHSQKDTKLAIVIVERNTISDIHRWNRLEHDRTSNELAQIIRHSWGKTVCTVSLVYRT